MPPPPCSAFSALWEDKLEGHALPGTPKVHAFLLVWASPLEAHAEAAPSVALCSFLLAYI